MDHHPNTHLHPALLSVDLLGLVFRHLDISQLLSTVPLVCKRWNAACRDSPQLWPRVELLAALDAAGVGRLQRFQPWLAPRARHVKSLGLCTLGTTEEQEEMYREQAWATALEIFQQLAPSLERLELIWAGALEGGSWLLTLRGLTWLELDATSLHLGAKLSELSRLQRLTLFTQGGQLTFPAQEDGLPTSLRAMVLVNASPLRLPSYMSLLTNLERLHISECTLELGAEAGEGREQRQGMPFPQVLGRMTSLQQLSLHCCRMTRLPREISALTGLRVLLLDSNIHPPLEYEPDADLGEIMEKLVDLQILGISSSMLKRMPLAVTGLTSLRCLYAEDNRLAELPQGPYLWGLQLLSLDWRTLLGCGGRLLPAATSLRKLYICKPFPYQAPAGDITRQAQLAAVIDKIVEHQSLHTLRFVIYDSNRLKQQVEMTGMMLALARRCPAQLDFGVLPYDQFFAVNLDTIAAEIAGAEFHEGNRATAGMWG